MASRKVQLEDLWFSWFVLIATTVTELYYVVLVLMFSNILRLVCIFLSRSSLGFPPYEDFAYFNKFCTKNVYSLQYVVHSTDDELTKFGLSNDCPSS